MCKGQQELTFGSTANWRRRCARVFKSGAPADVCQRQPLIFRQSKNSWISRLSFAQHETSLLASRLDLTFAASMQSSLAATVSNEDGLFANVPGSRARHRRCAKFCRGFTSCDFQKRRDSWKSASFPITPNDSAQEERSSL